ncbi:hypothetical protein PR048_011608 [Dryococelus australis]|uniref:Uncharacterized protein n=1 Tax=Dryococelus australis TaxID=614101 RepID=A0ABQ9HMT4_9NEOP|nr:hypothetical protein PR048_011608 [Dryococelus australis]
MRRREKQEIPEKTRRPAASTSTIPTCENPEATSPGIKPGSPRWWDHGGKRLQRAAFRLQLQRHVADGSETPASVGVRGVPAQLWVQ